MHVVKEGEEGNTFFFPVVGRSPVNFQCGSELLSAAAAEEPEHEHKECR